MGGQHPNTDFCISTESLGKRFNRDWIFRKLDYTFTPGNIYAITGPNGSGKSTLLQTLWGQIPPSKGMVHYIHQAKTVSADNVFRHTAIATPYMDLMEEFTLEEHVQFHFKMRQSRQNLDTAAIIAAMQLEHARHKYIANFSSGMKQRVKLGLAFFTRAQALFLDEPGTNLDHPSFLWYLDQLAAIPKDCLVFIASNQPQEYPTNSEKIDIMSYK